MSDVFAPQPLWSTHRPHLGTVREFDVQRGLGVIDSDGAALSFHCTAIADGSRTIEVGVQVSFVVVAGRSGRFEASGVMALGSVEASAEPQLSPRKFYLSPLRPLALPPRE